MWKAQKYFQSPKLYKENGFLKRETAQELINYLEAPLNPEEKKPDCTLIKIEKKKEQKQPPLLFNLAELQNTCSRRFKISPDETLKIVQELYEKKMVTYPRTDARVLSTAVAKEIGEVYAVNVIPRPHDDIAKILPSILSRRLADGIFIRFG